MIYYPDSAMSVGVVQGDLTTTHLDAVVNAGNTSLWLGSGVAGAIRNAGGPSIQAELDRIANPGGSLGMPAGQRVCDFGHVVVTHAGKMRAKYILHAAVMDCKGPLKAQTGVDIIRMCTVNCMLKMRELRLNGIAIPLFGTGVGGWDYYQSARIMARAVREYYHEGIVNFYAFDAAAFKGTQEAIEEVFK